MISIKDVHPNPNQPRKVFKDKDLAELSESIKQNGVIQPIIVVQSEDGFELVAGERRWRACKKAGITLIPAIVKRATEKDKMVMAIIENVQRSDLNCVETALAYYQLMNDFNLTQEEVAKKLGKERSSVANHLRILKLPRDVVELLQREELSFGHAKVLASGQDREHIIRIAKKAAEEKMSVRELEKLMKQRVKPIGEKAQDNPYAEKMDALRQRLEQKTGFHFDIKSKKSGAGSVLLKFGNEAEFNDIFEYLMRAPAE